MDIIFARSDKTKNMDIIHWRLLGEDLSVVLRIIMGKSKDGPITCNHVELVVILVLLLIFHIYRI